MQRYGETRIRIIKRTIHRRIYQMVERLWIFLIARHISILFIVYKVY